jgi:hypothetical protein
MRRFEEEQAEVLGMMIQEKEPEDDQKSFLRPEGDAPDMRKCRKVNIPKKNIEVPNIEKVCQLNAVN